MQYTSPFSFFPNLIEKTIEKKDINLAKRKWLTEFELQGTTTIIINQREFTKNELIHFFDNFEKLPDIQFHLLIIQNKVLFNFLQNNQLETDTDFIYKIEKYPPEFSYWLRSYIKEPFLIISAKKFKNKDTKAIETLVELSKLIIKDRREDLWHEVHKTYQELVSFLKDSVELFTYTKDSSAINRHVNADTIIFLNKLPSEYFEELHNKYAIEIMNAAVEILNIQNDKKQACELIKSGLELNTSIEIKSFLTEKRSEIENHITNTATKKQYKNRQYNTSNNRSNIRVFLILGILISIITIFIKVTFLNKGYNQPIYIEKKEDDISSSMTEKEKKVAEFWAISNSYNTDNDSILNILLSSISEDGNKLNHKHKIEVLKTGTDPYIDFWQSKYFKETKQTINNLRKDSLKKRNTLYKETSLVNVKNNSQLNVIIFVSNDEEIYSRYINANTDYTIELINGKNKVYVYAGKEFSFDEDIQLFANKKYIKPSVWVQGKFINKFPKNLHLLSKPIFYYCEGDNKSSFYRAEIELSSVDYYDETKIFLHLYDAPRIFHLSIWDDYYN